MHETLKLNQKELRKFGLIMGSILGGLLGLLIPWIKHRPIPHWPWVSAGTFWLLAAIAPLTLKHFYIIWIKIGSLLGWVNTRIILSVLFFLIIMPVGVLMRLFRKDPLFIKKNPQLQTYRINSKKTPPNHFLNPF